MSSEQMSSLNFVLILIVVEERIGFCAKWCVSWCIWRLNPYCSGRKNRIALASKVREDLGERLNPYCSGRKNRIRPKEFDDEVARVLILIVVEERIGCNGNTTDFGSVISVLILIVVEERIGFANDPKVYDCVIKS